MPDRCGHVRRDRLTFELFQAEDGFEDFASSILAAKWKNSHLYFAFSYSCCEAPADARYVAKYFLAPRLVAKLSGRFSRLPELSGFVMWLGTG